MTDPSFIYDERDRIDTMLEQREPMTPRRALDILGYSLADELADDPLVVQAVRTLSAMLDAANVLANNASYQSLVQWLQDNASDIASENEQITW